MKMAKKYGYFPPIFSNPLTPDTDKNRQNVGEWFAEQLQNLAEGKNNFKIIWLNKVSGRDNTSPTFEAFYEWKT